MIYKKLNAARAEFHSLALKKSGLNKFAGYQYFELSDFLIPAMSVFMKHGIAAVVSFGPDIATMRLVDVDKPDDVISITSPMGSAELKGCHVVQNIGAVETYQRRYLWVAALEIVEHDALDATTGKDAKNDVKAPMSAKEAALGDVFRALSPDTQNSVRRVCADAVRFASQGNQRDAVALLKAQQEESDDPSEMMKAQWYLLDSGTRTKIKKHEAEA